MLSNQTTLTGEKSGKKPLFFCSPKDNIIKPILSGFEATIGSVFISYPLKGIYLT
jgi:hypothetical protein